MMMMMMIILYGAFLNGVTKMSGHMLCRDRTDKDLIVKDEPSLYTVKAVLIMDNDGERLYAKYYDDTYPTVKEQKAFEKNIFNKTHRTDSEIALLEGLTVVYKSNIDLYFYVIGSSHENELMLMSVLNCLFDSLSQMLRKNVEKRALLENMEGLFLAVDEIVDGGVILESDPQQVVHRVALRGDDVPLTEQTVTQCPSATPVAITALMFNSGSAIYP
ncbi:Coatomer subunit zeta-1 [Anabarilius grahami]|uniref:Coatomer subunit zeta n=1 Tax=Anabarilius grahami TaxID=495550 RepID=A0A3N0Z1X8_ANAGA|nr:Coatomer subunit zeta-1 [Anabarilius grahami]